jgi:hypothetical protein
MSEPTDADRERIAAAVRLEEELARTLSCFGFEHGALIRQACGVPVEVSDLDAVVLTTMFGHALDKMRKLHGSDHTRRVTVALLEQLDQAQEQFLDAAGESAAHSPPPPRETMN